MEVNGIVEGTGTDPSVEATFKRPGGVRAAGDPKTTTHAKPERTPGTLDRQTDRPTDRPQHTRASLGHDIKTKRDGPHTCER